MATIRSNLRFLAILSTGALAILLIFFSPQEKTLGPVVKLVYAHAALMWVGLILYTIAALSAGIFMFSKKNTFWFWGEWGQKVATFTFFATFLLGLFTAKLAWGAIFWGEPRFRMLIIMIFFSVALFPAYSIGGKTRVVASLVVLAAIAVWIFLIRTELVFHPRSPILSSESLAIKIFPFLIAAVFLALALQIVTLFGHRSARKNRK